MADDTCPTCTESYNRTTRKRVECLFCHYGPCLSCSQFYILSVVQEPHCMNCKRLWSREFVDDRFSRQFVNNELKSHREAILFEQQKNLLVQTQENIKLLRAQREYEEQIEQIQDKIVILENQVAELEYKKNAIRPLEVQKEYHNDIMLPCPSSTCRGFIENNLKCGICSTTICITCHEMAVEPHTCKPEIVDSVRLLQEDTKRCPNCAVQIFKTSGCDQMWCTNCKIAFDWKTGEKVRGIIHNPHYYQYLEENGGHVPPANCEQHVQFVTTEELIKALRSTDCPNELFHQLVEVYRYTIHYHQVDLQRLPTRFDHDSNIDLRMRFLMNEINEDEFKTKLQRRQKDIEKKIEYRDIGETYVYLVNDMFRLFLQHHDLAELIRHITLITKQSHEAISILNKRYNSTLPLIRIFL